MTRPVLIMFLVLLLIAAGLGYYAYHWSNRVAIEEQQMAQRSQTVLPPASGPTTLVTLYVASDADGSLRRSQENVALPQERSERARAVLRRLFGKYSQGSSTHPIGAGSDVRDVFLMAGNTAIVDTTAPFADSHPSGVLVEELTIASMVETITANIPGTTRVKFLIDGRSQPTLAGHAELSISYDVSAVQQLAAALQNTP